MSDNGHAVRDVEQTRSSSACASVIASHPAVGLYCRRLLTTVGVRFVQPTENPDIAVVDIRTDHLESALKTATTFSEGTRWILLCSAADDLSRMAIPAVRLSGVVRYEDLNELGMAVESVLSGRAWFEVADLKITSYRSANDAAGFTCREREVLGLLLGDLSNKEIGSRLRITERTVKMHVSHILAKCNVTSRRQLPAMIG